MSDPEHQAADSPPARDKQPARIETKPFHAPPGQPVRLKDRPSRQDGGMTHAAGRRIFRKLSKRLVALQELLYADSRHALLVVLQAMDSGGKDSTIRHVFGPVNPQGCTVSSFKAPTGVELAHDYLWRIHQRVPPRGMIGVFNRSHYEDVLAVRVRELAPHHVWERRFDHINAFEQMLADEGVSIVKFFLHISRGYQKQRLQRRLDHADKQWKFDPADLDTRARWEDYQQAYEDVLSRCSTPSAPWYVVPAERRWFRNLVVAQVLVDTLEGLKMTYPRPAYDPKSIHID